MHSLDTLTDYGLITHLHSGEPIVATRASLEANLGWWDDRPELCEDGRATRLASLPGGGALFLGKTGDILAVQPIPASPTFAARLFSGTAGRAAWRAVEDCYPGVSPGEGAFPRFWLLHEQIAPRTRLYGMFDLFNFEALSWDPDPAAIRAVIARRSAKSV